MSKSSVKSYFYSALFGRRFPRGQGLVEFALILPLLLLVIFGIMELGRLMVIYSSVQAASREAARYASAAGTSSAGVPYYLDTAGITAAAHRVAMLVDPDSVDISWDHGPDDPSPRTSVPAASSVLLGDRVNVTVTAQYEPMLGLTPLEGFPIVSTTSRTIIKEVVVGMGPGGGGGGGGGTPPTAIIDSPTTDPTITVNLGDTIPFHCTAVEPDGQSVTYSWYEGATNYSNSESFSTSSLLQGTHFITCRVEDSDGMEGTDTIEVIVNGPPEVFIESPDGGVAYENGTLLTFTGRADDLEDGDLSDELTWFDNGVEFGSGDSFDYSALAVGYHVIRAEVADSNGLIGWAAITLTIESLLPPELTILSPANNSAYGRNETVVFQATAIDSKDGDLGAYIVWSSDIDGDLHLGATFSTDDLSIGVHTITASVTDSDSLTTTRSILVRIVDDDPPTVELLTPAQLEPPEHFVQFVEIPFSATATDTSDGDLSDQIRWFSSVPEDGEFGYGASVPYSGLSAGLHTITARVTDSDGLSDTDQVVIYIDEVPNTAPTIFITSPQDNTSGLASRPVRLSGNANDAEEGNISNLIQWTSDLAGPLGTGSTITRTLSIGTHLITAVITDSLGLSATASVSYRVRPLICPAHSSVSYNYTDNNNLNQIIWTLSVPSGTIEPVLMEQLGLTFVTSTPRISNIMVDNAIVAPPWSGTTPPYVAVGPQVWTNRIPGQEYVVAYNSIQVVFNFTSAVHRNQAGYTITTKFEECAQISHTATPPQRP